MGFMIWLAKTTDMGMFTPRNLDMDPKIHVCVLHLKLKYICKIIPHLLIDRWILLVNRESGRGQIVNPGRGERYGRPSTKQGRFTHGNERCARRGLIYVRAAHTPPV